MFPKLREDGAELQPQLENEQAILYVLLGVLQTLYVVV